MKLMYAHLFAIKHIDIHLITEGPSSGRSFLQILLVQPHLLAWMLPIDTLLTNGTAATHGVL